MEGFRPIISWSIPVGMGSVFRVTFPWFCQSQRDCALQPNGCEPRATLGKRSKRKSTPTGLRLSPMQDKHRRKTTIAGRFHTDWPNPVGVETILNPHPRLAQTAGHPRQAGLEDEIPLGFFAKRTRMRTVRESVREPQNLPRLCRQRPVRLLFASGRGRS